MAKEPSKYIAERAKFIKEHVSAASKRGVKTKHVVNELSKQLFVSPRTIYNDLYK